jgi:hypothetical protein
MIKETNKKFFLKKSFVPEKDQNTFEEKKLKVHKIRKLREEREEWTCT